jgi:periplasmic copper chaperone A
MSPRQTFVVVTLCFRAVAGILLVMSSAAQAVFTVNAPWVRPAADRTATDAYMRLSSTEGAVLKEAKSPLAASIVIRAGKNAGRTLPQLPLPPGDSILLAPGEVRLVLRGLEHPFALGERVPIVLTIEGADGSRVEIPVNAEVRLHSPIDDERHAHQHAH